MRKKVKNRRARGLPTIQYAGQLSDAQSRNLRHRSDLLGPGADGELTQVFGSERERRRAFRDHADRVNATVNLGRRPCAFWAYAPQVPPALRSLDSWLERHAPHLVEFIGTSHPDVIREDGRLSAAREQWLREYPEQLRPGEAEALRESDGRTIEPRGSE